MRWFKVLSLAIKVLHSVVSNQGLIRCGFQSRSYTVWFLIKVLPCVVSNQGLPIEWSDLCGLLEVSSKLVCWTRVFRNGMSWKVVVWRKGVLN